MVFPSTITQFIYAQPLPIPGSPSTLTDDHVWDHHASICSVKSAYYSLVPKSNGVIGRTLVIWSWIWKLKIPPKIQLFFFWKCAHHHIPTKSIIFPHAALRDQVCHRCNEIEMPIHVQCDCHFACHIWSSFLVHLLLIFLALSSMIGVNLIPNLLPLRVISHGTLYLLLPCARSGWVEIL